MTPFPSLVQQREWLTVSHHDVVVRYVFGRPPSDALRVRIAQWLRFHGFADGLVCASPGWIERDPIGYAVRAEVYAVDPADPDRRLYDRREVEERRSEGPPLPFPDIPDDEWVSISTLGDERTGALVRMMVVVTAGPS